jgi:hypothetical protein
MARAGIRALDTKGHRSRAAFAGELNFREEHPKAEVRRVEDLRLARGWHGAMYRKRSSVLKNSFGRFSEPR